MIDLSPPPLILSKPAIIRPATSELLRYSRDPIFGMAILGHGLRRAAGGPISAISAFAKTAEPTDTSNTNSYSFTGVSIGAADAARHVVVLMQGNGGTTNSFSSVTIGGIAATIVVELKTADTISGIAIAAVPTGTTATIAVSLAGSSTALRMALTVYRMVGAASATPVDFTSNTSSGSNALDLSISVTQGGVLVAGTAKDSNSTNTWTGPTEDNDRLVESSAAAYSAASLYPSTSGSVSVVNSFGFDTNAGVSASFA